ncbi:MAG: glycosyltransferase [Prevotellaceae bacterium]|jgi:glycosyltransferase involved in cell wall biosynthesis|nr:glycosyltransferase [Prevotellaceae bacterium]
MNILFVFNTDISPTAAGGATGITHKLECAFRERGCNTSLAFFEQHQTPSPIKNKIQITKPFNKCEFECFLTKNKIDTIVVSTLKKQKAKYFLPLLKQIATAKNIQTLFWLHGMPGYEIITIKNKNVLLYRILHQKNKIKNIKLLLLSLFPISDRIGKILLRRKYALLCNSVDNIVLLSNHFISAFKEYANCFKNNKFTAINNCLTFDKYADKQIISGKEKIVLIVSRLEEYKRISLALKIWQQAEKNCVDWKLVIVGKGEDEDYYKRFAKKLQLKNYTFEGWQNPLEYYKRASIFMMTSSHEGFPMVLGEAQQMGVVPIVFDSFGAVHDIVKNNFNGVVIENNNINLYAEKLIMLMKNATERQLLAKNALDSCKRFSTEIIIEKWKNLFEKNLNL